MQTYPANAKGPLKMNQYIDPDDVTKISVYWGPDLFSTNTVYLPGDICKPTESNGYYYQCTVAGKTDDTEPQWNQESVISGTAEFIAVPWDLWLQPDQILTASTWSVSDAIPLVNDIYTDNSTSVYVNAFDSTITEFEITNQVTKDNGEKLSRSFKYKTNQQ
mgnify:CR=1 FL=1